MKTLELGELESGLRECLAALSEGEEVLIQDGDHPLARLVKVPQYADAPQDDHEAQTRQMEAEGKVTRGKGKIDWDKFLAQERPYVSEEAMKQALDWARSDRF